MKFPTFALLSCTFLIQSSTALRSSNQSELRSCFLKCGRKDVDKANKVEDCQTECVDDQTATGRSSSSIGPFGEWTLCCGTYNWCTTYIRLLESIYHWLYLFFQIGAKNLLLCGARCAERAEDRFDRKRRNFDGKDEKDCKKKCDSGKSAKVLSVWFKSLSMLMQFPTL